jgi:hypothetical protein
VLNLGAMSVGSAGELFYAPAHGLGGLVWGVPKGELKYMLANSSVL